MSFVDHKETIQEGDLVFAYIGRDNIKPIKVKDGEFLNTRYGVFPHASMIGKPYGSQITSTKEIGFIHLLHPTPELWTTSLPHRTQIVYTSDSSYILQRLNVVPGSRVIEAGTGSGSFSHSFARNIHREGHLFSYEFHGARCEQAKIEFEEHGLSDIVTLTHRDVCKDGFEISDDTKVDGDTIFLDLPAPWEAIPHLSKVIAKDRAVGICCFSPCIEQVVKTVEALQEQGWIDIEMTEIAGLKWEARKEMVREVDEAINRLKDVRQRQKDGIEKQKQLNEDESGKKREKEEDEELEEKNHEHKKQKNHSGVHEKAKDYGYNPFGKGRRVFEGDEDFQWFNISKTGAEIKTHTSYLTFATFIPILKSEE